MAWYSIAQNFKNDLLLHLPYFFLVLPTYIKTIQLLKLSLNNKFA